MLESTTLAEHEGNLFCKQCYARKFVRQYFAITGIFFTKKNLELLGS